MLHFSKYCVSFQQKPKKSMYLKNLTLNINVRKLSTWYIVYLLACIFLFVFETYRKEQLTELKNVFFFLYWQKEIRLNQNKGIKKLCHQCNFFYIEKSNYFFKNHFHVMYQNHLHYENKIIIHSDA